MKLPQYFFRIAVLIVYVFNVILWLGAWANAASWAKSLLDLTRNSSSWIYKDGAALAACAGIGALVW
jgi:hypothetical protein